MPAAIFTKLNSTPAGNVLTVDREYPAAVTRESMTATTTPDINETLGLTPGGRRRRIGRWLIAALVLVVLAGVLLRFRATPSQAVSPYKTEAVQKGALTVSV